MHLCRQIHVYARIYLPEGGKDGDEAAQMLLSKYKRNEKEFSGLCRQNLQGGICNCSSASVRKCAALIFQLLEWFGNFIAVTSEKMYEKGLFAKLENEK